VNGREYPAGVTQLRRMKREYHGWRHCRPSVTVRVAKTGVRDWTKRKRKKNMGTPQLDLNLQRGLYQNPLPQDRTKALLKLNTDQSKWVVGLFTGHCYLKGHFLKLGFANDPICERCLEEQELSTHTLCDCEAMAYLRFRHLGQFFFFFLEPSDCYGAPIYKALHFIRGVGLIQG
jgi:hypothetical protein